MRESLPLPPLPDLEEHPKQGLRFRSHHKEQDDGPELTYGEPTSVDDEGPELTYTEEKTDDTDVFPAIIRQRTRNFHLEKSLAEVPTTPLLREERRQQFAAHREHLKQKAMRVKRELTELSLTRAQSGLSPAERIKKNLALRQELKRLSEQIKAAPEEERLAGLPAEEEIRTRLTEIEKKIQHTPKSLKAVVSGLKLDKEELESQLPREEGSTSDHEALFQSSDARKKQEERLHRAPTEEQLQRLERFAAEKNRVEAEERKRVEAEMKELQELGQVAETQKQLAEAAEHQKKIARQKRAIQTCTEELEHLQETYRQRYGGELVRAAQGEEGAGEGLVRIGRQILGFFKREKPDLSRQDLITKYRRTLDDLAVGEDTLSLLQTHTPERFPRPLHLKRVPLPKTRIGAGGGGEGIDFTDLLGRKTTDRVLEEREEEEGRERADRTEARAERMVGSESWIEKLERASSLNAQEEQAQRENVERETLRTILLAGRTPDQKPINSKLFHRIQNIVHLPFISEAEMKRKLPREQRRAVEGWGKFLKTVVEKRLASPRGSVEPFIQRFQEDSIESALTHYALTLEALALLPHRTMDARVRKQLIEEYVNTLLISHRTLGLSSAEQKRFDDVLKLLQKEPSASRPSQTPPMQRAA